MFDDIFPFRRRPQRRRSVEERVRAALSPWAVGQMSEVHLTPEQLAATSERLVAAVLEELRR